MKTDKFCWSREARSTVSTTYVHNGSQGANFSSRSKISTGAMYSTPLAMPSRRWRDIAIKPVTGRGAY